MLSLISTFLPFTASLDASAMVSLSTSMRLVRVWVLEFSCLLLSASMVRGVSGMGVPDLPAVAGVSWVVVIGISRTCGAVFSSSMAALSRAFALGILFLVPSSPLFWSFRHGFIVKCGSFFSGPLSGSVGFVCWFLDVLTVIVLASKVFSSSSLQGVDFFLLLSYVGFLPYGKGL